MKAKKVMSNWQFKISQCEQKSMEKGKKTKKHFFRKKEVFFLNHQELKKFVICKGKTKYISSNNW